MHLPCTKTTFSINVPVISPLVHLYLALDTQYAISAYAFPTYGKEGHLLEMDWVLTVVLLTRTLVIAKLILKSFIFKFLFHSWNEYFFLILLKIQLWGLSSSAYTIVVLNSSAMVNREGLGTEPLWMHTSTLNASLYSWLTLILLTVPLYISYTTLTNHLSIPNFLRGHQITEQNTLPKAFSRSTNTKYKGLL